MARLKEVVLWVSLGLLMAFCIDKGLDAWEHKDCHNYQKWAAEGHDIVVPEWCYSQGYLSK